MLCPRCGKSVRSGGHSRGKARWRCDDRKVCRWHGTEPIGLNENETVPVSKALHRRISRATRLVITAAQNATPVNGPFFKSLLVYCDHMNAQLVVIPYRYKNPTSMWTAQAENDDWWAAELLPYIYDKRINIGPHLTLLADIKAQPTSVRPLSGFESMTGPRSAIVGHPKLELLTVPTPQQNMAKILVTTGAVTEKNYIPSKAGKKAEFHHTHGASVVELADDGTFFVRQINAAHDGSFCDLDYEYTPHGLPTKCYIEALDMGDTHVDFADPTAVEATFGEEGIINTLRPKYLVWHDVLDFYSRNHHHEKEVFINYVKHQEGRNNVEQEVDRCFAFIDKHSPPWCKNIFVYSNHPDGLARWVKSADPKLDPENCVFWAKTFAAMCEGSQMTNVGVSTIDPFAWWAKQKLGCYKRSKFLAPDESCMIKGIETGYHGHYGPGGSRGALRQFTKIGAKSVIGHSHAPGINEGAYQVGTTSHLTADYVKGPTAWLHAHCAIYKNGKRSLIIIVNGKWRRED